MRRLAVFTEGQTEQIFLQRFIEHVGGAKKIQFDLASVPTNPVLAKLVSRDPNLPAPRYFVLLYNCQNDDRVKSEILAQRESLTKAGYDLILGVRDLYPQPLSNLASVKLNLKTRVPTAGVPIHILLAVSEIEAWFLQDETHYQKVDARLDVSTFKLHFDFDPSVDSAENIPQPANLLHQIYSTVGKAYRKSKSHVERTVDVLDYDRLYLEKTGQLPHLAELIGHLNAFFV